MGYTCRSFWQSAERGSVIRPLQPYKVSGNSHVLVYANGGNFGPMGCLVNVGHRGSTMYLR